MEYERTILELIERVKVLEEKVASLLNEREADPLKREHVSGKAAKVGTVQIKEYIYSLLSMAREQGKSYVEITSNQIHKALGLTRRMPTVCNAMKQCMRDGDEVIHKTASGYSSTFEIRYMIEKKGHDYEK